MAAAGMTPAEALQQAVCDSDSGRIGELLDRFPELRAKIDHPLPTYGFGQHAMFAAVQRSDRSTIEILLRAGANIQKRTEWRYLVSRGCKTDLLMAAALGDLELVRAHLDENPESIRMRVSKEWFPNRDPRAESTIYIWTLGGNRTAHTMARDFGHEDVFRLLMERTPDDLKLSLACELGPRHSFRHYGYTSRQMRLSLSV